MEKNPLAQEEKDAPPNVEQEVAQLQLLISEMETTSAMKSSVEDHILKVQEDLRQVEKNMGIEVLVEMETLKKQENITADYIWGINDTIVQQRKLLLEMQAAIVKNEQGQTRESAMKRRRCAPRPEPRL